MVHHHPKAEVPIPAPLVANGRRCIPTINTFANLMRVLQPLAFADAPVCAIELPPDFEALSPAIAEQCAITIIYNRGSPRPGARTITPPLMLEVHGAAYVIAHGHRSAAERTFRLDHIRECWLE